MATTTAPTAAEATRPVFLYDDCCPLCRGYTKTFTALGWAERAPFSSIDDDTLAALDMDRARHHIPLHDADGETRYGLDGILDVVEGEVAILGRIGKPPRVRALLDRLYWFITYNRRHIVAAAPPVDGVDCAPDFEPEPVAAYLTFCGVTATGLALASGTAPAVAGAAAAGAALVRGRDASWDINPMEAAGHAGSVAVAAAGVGALVRGVTGKPELGVAAVGATAARKLWLRRWMRATKPVAVTPPA